MICKDLSGNAEKTKVMESIRFVINDDDEKTAVLIDLTKYSELCEDFYDRITARRRDN